MRVVLVVPGGVGPDGVHEVIPAILSLVRRLAARHDLLVVATEQRADPASYRLEGAAVLALGRRHGRRPEPLARLRGARRMIQAIRTFRPDVVHAVWLGGSGSTAAVLAAGLARVPLVVSVGGGELVALPRIGYGGARTWRGRAHVALALRRAAAVTAGSRTALEPVLRRRRDAHLVPLGAERQPDVPRPAHDPADGPLRLVVAASVNRVKGPDVVIGALARIRAVETGGARDRTAPGGRAPRASRGVRLAWLGEDTLNGSTIALARAIGVADLVELRGFRPHRLVLDAWREADLAIQGSYHESQGVAVLEAAMAGVPTVGTAVGLVAELAAADPPAAVAIPVGDPAALGDAILALAGDPERRARLGAAARAWAEAHDADWTAATFEAIYAGVTARR